MVEEKLGEDWTRQQISGWLKRQYFNDGAAMRVSHETIYRTWFVQARGVLKKELPIPLFAAFYPDERLCRASCAAHAGMLRGRSWRRSWGSETALASLPCRCHAASPGPVVLLTHEAGVRYTLCITPGLTSLIPARRP